MIFPPELESKLGFDQLRQRLNNYCLSGLGLREVERIVFSADFVKIKALLTQTSEFKQILEKSEPFPSQHYFDPGELLKTAEKAGFEVLLTTDKNMVAQQNLKTRTIAIVVLGNSQWRIVQRYVRKISAAVNGATPGSYAEVDIPLK